MTVKDPEKERDKKRRYLERKKIAKYGYAAIGVNMTGRHGNHAKGAKNGRWNKGQLLSSHGYVLVRVPRGHHRAFGNGYAYEHDVVMETVLGRPLQPGEVVHHKNEVKTDNRPENLELLSASDHMRLHDATRLRDEDGRFLRDRKGGNPSEWPADLRVREFPEVR